MRVFVPQGLVAMPMGMRFCDFTLMGVFMMLVMHMAVLVLQFGVDMIMLVPLRQMQPEANRH